MAVVYVVAERDAQGRVIALPPFDVLMGLSSDSKPTVDRTGRALKYESEFWERDTARRYIWDGVLWQEVVSQETLALRGVAAQLERQTEAVWALLRGVALLSQGMEFNAEEVMGAEK